MADEAKKTYRVKEGQHWGTNPELQPGETVELTEKEYTGFEDKLEPLGAAPKDAESQAPAVPKRPAS
jgi:hypothetical protein